MPGQGIRSLLRARPASGRALHSEEHAPSGMSGGGIFHELKLLDQKRLDQMNRPCSSPLFRPAYPLRKGCARTLAMVLVLAMVLGPNIALGGKMAKRRVQRAKALARIRVRFRDRSETRTVELTEDRIAVPLVPQRYGACEVGTAGDLLDEALRRIDKHLFLTQDRLDFFLGNGYFDAEFASKYLHENWASYASKRKVDMYERCAVVGNSGHLTLSRYGGTIDSFDAVLRTNQAPTQGYEDFVGHKTTFRLLNRAMARRYQEAMESRLVKLYKIKRWFLAHMHKWKPRSSQTGSLRSAGGDQTLARLSSSAALKRLGVTEQMLSKVPNDASVLQELKGIMAGVGDSNIRVEAGEFPLEKQVTVVLVTELSSLRQEMEGFIRAARNLRPDVKVVIKSGNTRDIIERMLARWYERLAACHGVRTPQGQGGRASTGILATMTMLKQCRNVTLYGFGAAINGTDAAPFHYYTGHMSRNHSTASNSVHYFGGEFQLLLKLKQEGRLTICTEADPPTCGLPEALIRDFPSEDLLKGQAEDKDMDEDLGEGAASADEASTDRGSTRPDAGGTSLLPLDEQ